MFPWQLRSPVDWALRIRVWRSALGWGDLEERVALSAAPSPLQLTATTESANLWLLALAIHRETEGG